MKLLKSDQIISYIASYLPNDPCLIEAGAFTGHDSLRLACQFPLGTIHAFEPVPNLYFQLQNRVAKQSNIRTYCIALNTKSGNAPLYVAEKAPGKITQASSLRPPKERLSWSSVQF